MSRSTSVTPTSSKAAFPVALALLLGACSTPSASERLLADAAAFARVAEIEVSQEPRRPSLNGQPSSNGRSESPARWHDRPPPAGHQSVNGHAERGPGGFYIGGSAGYSDGRSSAGQLEGRLAGKGQNTSIMLDDTDISWKAYSGYRFDFPLAVELGYTSLAGVRSSISVGGSTPSLTQNVVEEHPIAGHGVTLAALLPLTIGDFTAFVKGGGWYWWSETDINLGFTTIETKDEGLDFFYGGGAQFYIVESLGLRAEFERYLLDGDEVDLWSAGVVIRF